MPVERIYYEMIEAIYGKSFAETFFVPISLARSA